MNDILSPFQNAELDLSGLCQAAKTVLQAAGLRVGDDRVSSFPDKRTVRYYQSLALIPSPLRYDGRKAIYGWPHLLRVVCVKLLQSQGLSLAQIQGTLPSTALSQIETAVREALSLPQPEAVSRVAAPRALVSAELAPGITVTIDPACVDSPEDILSELFHALSRSSPQLGDLP